MAQHARAVQSEFLHLVGTPPADEPCLEADQLLDSPRLDAVNLQSKAPSHLRMNAGRPRVLAVEDERIVARYLNARLSKLGYEVTGLASSRKEALQLAESTRPDLVLMDIRLNGVPEGIEAAREIRERFGIPVVFLTAHSDSETLECAKDAKPYGYILKPFEDRDLAVTIETSISRYRTEKQLRESEERLRLAQQASRVGVLDWNLETGEVLLTPEMEELYEIPAGAFGGDRAAWIACFHLEDQRQYEQFFDAWIESGLPEQRWEHRIFLSSGEFRWLEGRAQLHRNNIGEAARIVGAELDITDRKRMEENLREKERELQRSNSDLQAYAHTVSHDLKEPLRTISCCVGLLESSCGSGFDESYREFMTLAIQGAKRMQNLIDSLLQFSRVGQPDRPQTTVDCNAVVNSVLVSLSSMIEETGARISFASLPTVVAWGDRLNQLFQNLIANALKYRRPNTTPKIRVSAAWRDAAWQFSVEDNGIGFEAKHAETIFGVFKRLHSDEYEGAGIGLSVCKRIVEHHGGRIWASSTPGCGSTFRFTLPQSCSNEQYDSQSA